MSFNKTLSVSFLFTALVFATLVFAAPAYAAKTPLGATKEGNRAGTIPAWTGGITKPPAGYQKGKHHKNPFAKDKPLYVISARNVEKYKKNLTATHYAMIKRYPKTFKMSVYKTRRSCALPQSVYRAIAANGKRARLTNGGNNVEGATIATPFPNPKNPVEIYWNHKFHYQGLRQTETMESGAIFANGTYVPIVREQKKLFYYADPKTAAAKVKENVHFHWFSKFISPTPVSGQMFSFTNTIDQVAGPRRGIVYNVGQRRTARVPTNASQYDASMASYGGVRISDDLFIYNGAPDKYQWKLLGKKEMIIPYNVYEATSVPTKKLLGATHINQSVMRYELHRVWVLEGTLKKGQRHKFPRRVFYADEDSYIFAAADLYGTSGKLERGQIGYIKNYYEEPTCRQDFDTVYYFAGENYYSVDNVKNNYAPTNLRGKVKPTDFGSQAIKRQAR